MNHESQGVQLSYCVLVLEVRPTCPTVLRREELNNNQAIAHLEPVIIAF